MTPQEFAQKIKSKYPQYAEMDDLELTQKILEKYPVYQSKVQMPLAETTPPTKNLGELTGAQYKASGEKIVESVTRAADRAAEEFGRASAVGNTPTERALHTAKATLRLGEGGLGVASGALQGIFAPLTAVLQKGLQTINPEGKSTPVIAPEKIEAWAQAHPDAARNLMDAFIVGTAGVGGMPSIMGRTLAETSLSSGVGVAKTLASDVATGVKAVKTAVNQTGQGIKLPSLALDTKSIAQAVARTIYGKDADKLTASLKKDYEQIRLPKAIMQEEAQTGKSFAEFMSTKPHLSLPVENMTWRTWGTAQALRKEVSTEARALSELLANRVEQISEAKLITEMKQAVAEVATGTEREGILRFIDQELPVLVDQFATKIATGPAGERMLSVADWNKIKQVLWDRSPFKATASRADNLRSSVDYKMGQTIRRNIEEVVDDVDIRALNGQLGDYYHAIEILENLEGGAAPKGRIGADLGRIAGAIAGTPGGIIGSVAGYMAAGKAIEYLANPSITTGLKRLALEQLKIERPSVAKEVAQLLQKQANEAFKRRALPEPSFVPMGPYKGGAGTTPTVRAPAAQKGLVGVEPETGRFKGTYSSTAEEELQQNVHVYLDILGSKSTKPVPSPKAGGVPTPKLAGRGEFGDIYEGIKGQTAIDFLLSKGDGEVRAAFTRPDIGDIDLVWGAPGPKGYGLAHFKDRVGAIENLQEVVEKGFLEPSRDNSVLLIRRVEGSGGIAIVKLDWKGTPKRWIISAY